MDKNLNIWILVTICVEFTCAIYVPEQASDIINVNGGSYLPEKQSIRSDLPESVNKLTNINANEDDRKKLFSEQSLTNAHEQSPIPTQQKSYDMVDDVVLSKQYHIANVPENLEAQPTGLAEQQKHKMHNNDVVNKIIDEHVNYNTLQHSRQRRQLSDFLIAPNTRWCGRGNTANGTYNHLGGASMADKCCRTHDHCKVYIPAMSNRFDLFNYRPYTLSHCNCDRRFRTCLKMTNDEDANTIGKLFFNLVQTQCFVLHKEVICQERANGGTCLKEHIKQKAYLRHNKKY